MRPLMPATAVAALTLLFIPAGTPAVAAGPARTGTNQLVALSDHGRQAADRSSINGSAQVSSRHGRYVAFSTAAALVPEDVNGTDDVYLRDLARGRTTLVSVAADGTLGDDYSFEPTVSADSTRVAFTTWATTLLPDTNGSSLDVLVKDLTTGELRRVSVRNNGTQAPQNSFFPVISADGTHVAFQTFGRLGRKDRDRREDVYVRDLTTGRTRQVSLRPDGRDVRPGVIVGDVSDDGALVTFGDDNTVWLRDVPTRRTRVMWHEPNDPAQPFPMGSLGRPVISGNGRFAAFSTMSTTIVRGERKHWSDIFRLNLRTGRVRKVTVGAHGGLADGHSFIPSLSRTGRYVGFSSFAGNLAAGDVPGSDTFVRDMRAGTTYLASFGYDGSPANADSGRTGVAISGDGRSLVYESYASNLVASDTNEQNDVVIWRR